MIGERRNGTRSGTWSAAFGGALYGCLCASPALAAWPGNPGINLGVCVAAGDQIVPQVTADGAGGVLAVWVDHRAGNGDLYAIRLDVQGNRVAGWPANGLAVCVAPGEQDNPSIVGDGAGGAVIAWTDARAGNGDIYALRIQGNGTLAGGWPAGGLALCTAAGNQGPTWVLGDDTGGAYVVWRDGRGATFDLYATRVRNNGNIAGLWPANGLALCAAPGSQDLAALASDMQGGLYVAWQDERAGNADIYASRLRNNGSFLTGWGANGRAICASAGHQFAPAVASDGNRGLFVFWEDFRGASSSDLYGLCVLEDGRVATGWTAGGTPLCSAPGNQFSVQAIPDGAGNAILVWEDYRNGPANADVFAQKVRGNGAIFPPWPANGVAVCAAAGLQLAPALVSDGSLGAIVVWEDYRAGLADANVYGRRVDIQGSLPGAWGASGIPVSNAGGSQQFVAAAVGTNPIVLWQDGRSGNRNIYAQRVEVQGTLGMNAPAMMSAQPARGFESDHVWLTWHASPLDAAGGRIGSYRVWRDRLSMPAGATAAGATESRAIEPAIAIAESRVTREGRSDGEGRAFGLAGVIGIPGAIGEPQAAPRSLHSALGRRPDATIGVPGSSELPAEAPGDVTAHDWELVGTVAADGSSAYSIDVALPASPPASPGYGLFYVEAVAAGDPGITWSSAIFEAFPSTAPDPTGVRPVPGGRFTDLEVPRPNPVSTAARLRFALADDGPVELAIFSVDGRLIRALVRGTLPAGPHEIAWDRSTDGGDRVPGGVYFVRLESDGRRLVRGVSVVP